MIFGSKKREKILPINILTIGDNGQGKSSLLMTYCDNNTFPTSVPDVFSPKPKTMMFYGQQIKLRLFDTTQYAVLSNAQMHCIIILCSVTSENALENVRTHLLPEAEKSYPNTPIILAGSKTDLRKRSLVQRALRHTSYDLHNFRTLIFDHPSLTVYRECSAITGEGVSGLFDEALRLALSTTKDVGPFFDNTFRQSEYIGVVCKNNSQTKHYAAIIEEICPKFCKVRYLGDPFRWSNTEKIVSRIRIKPWDTESWLPLLWDECAATSEHYQLYNYTVALVEIIAEFAGSSKEEFNFIERQKGLSTRLPLNKFQSHLVTKSLELLLV